jgi:hypothetical protein
MQQSTRERAREHTCLQCGGPIPDPKPTSKFCQALCRNRYNNALAKMRPARESEHGTRTGYTRGCRCDLCKAFNATYSKEWRARQPKTPRKPRSEKGIKKVAIKPEDHGTTRAYAWFKCRCDACKKAAADYNRTWREANREKYRAAMRRFARQNPAKVRGYSESRAAAPFDAEALDYCDMISRDPCVYCGAPSESVDHIDPVSAGGNSNWGNLAPACLACNSSKGAKPLLEFLMYRNHR